MRWGFRCTLEMAALLGAVMLAACGASSDDDPAATGGAGGSSNQGGSNNQGGNNQGGSNNQGGGKNQGGNNQGGNSNKGGSGGGGPSCEGDFYLGKNVVTSGSTDTLGEACNGKAPTNCPDGTYLTFGKDDSCVCLVMCSSLQGISEGMNCSTDGSWVCEKIQATNASANSATVCVKKSWGLCSKTSSGQGGSGGGGQGGSGGSGEGGSGEGGSGEGGSGGGGSCIPSGGDCSFDSDCCSDSCSGFVCE